MKGQCVSRAEPPFITALWNTTYCAELLTSKERLSIEVCVCMAYIESLAHSVCWHHWVGAKPKYEVWHTYFTYICSICLGWNITFQPILYLLTWTTNCVLQKWLFSVCTSPLMWKWQEKSKQSLKKKSCMLQRVEFVLSLQIRHFKRDDSPQNQNIFVLTCSAFYQSR